MSTFDPVELGLGILTFTDLPIVPASPQTMTEGPESRGEVLVLIATPDGSTRTVSPVGRKVDSSIWIAAVLPNSFRTSILPRERFGSRSCRAHTLHLGFWMRGVPKGGIRAPLPGPQILHL